MDKKEYLELSNNLQDNIVLVATKFIGTQFEKDYATIGLMYFTLEKIKDTLE